MSVCKWYSLATCIQEYHCVYLPVSCQIVIEFKPITIKEALALKEFTAFLQAAKDYCSFIESFVPESPSQFLTLLREHLAHLYQSGLRLPEINLQNDQDFEDLLYDKVLIKTVSFISDRLPVQYYWHVFDPSDESNTNAVCGDLTDDLGEIYRDLKRMLLLFETDSLVAKENAVWELNFSFKTHWGEHCINALYAIHFLIPRTG